MFLGGSIFQIPPIKYAKSQGHYVITCDYFPDNPGHKFTDEYHNVSTTDKDVILKLSRKLKIDGIITYASDVSAPTVAYVGNKLGLPSNPYESVLKLVQKDLFRIFLKENNLNFIKANSFYNFEDAIDFFDEIKKPVLIKPVDSSGTKGISKIFGLNELKKAFEYALKYSIIKKVIVEEFIQRKNYQVAGDGFIVGENLKFRCFGNEHFDNLCNPLVPIGESFPSVLSNIIQNKAHKKIQTILSLLDMKIGALNFDYLIDENDQIYILEIGPRNGGNLIPEVTKHVTGIDMIKYTVDIALDESCNGLKMLKPKGYYSSYIIHSIKDGILKEINFEKEIEKNIIKRMIFVKNGQRVERFDNASLGLGALILKYDHQDEMLEKMDNMENYIKIIVE